MGEKSLNKTLNKANKSKNDDFYTQLTDIEKELKHYKKHFKNKVIFCNCDDPHISNFFHYFSYNFKQLGLKKLITTCYKNQQMNLFSDYKSEKAIYLEYTGDKNNVPDPKDIGIKHLKGDGDFRSQECIELLKQSDIVVTNPPFSLFKEYVAQLVEFNKKFLIIGNTNALSYKEIFKLFKENKIRTGYTNFNVGMFFIVPKDWKHFHHIDENGNKIARVSTSCWFTNLEVEKHKDFIILYKKYNSKEYPKYDNYNAINVNNVNNIPMDYKGVIGVPITFLGKYNPEQFEIVGQMATTKVDRFNHGYPYINDKKIYARILIKNKKL